MNFGGLKKQTFKHYFGNSYLWSLQKMADESRNYFYDSMTRVKSDNLVFLL